MSKPSDSSDLDEILITLAGHTLAENKKTSSEVKMSPLISKAKTQILSRYRSVADIKKAVGEMETTTGTFPSPYSETRVFLRNQLRLEILSALGIEEAKL